MGHEVHGADLVAVQIDGGTADDGVVFHGGGDAFRHLERISDRIVRVAVAADRLGGVERHGFLTAALGQGHRGQHRLGVGQLAV